MANSAMDTLKGILGDNADEKIKAALGAISSGDALNTETAGEDGIISADSSGADSDIAQSLMQIKGIVDNIAGGRDDSRTNLLMSLKPYMRDSRRGSIDAAVRMLKLSKLSALFRLR